MRILSVRFKNLNSLWGEWKIDFTDPAYSSDGIFVITGPAGAGKATILDAICLALYGRTPRLREAGGIMSREAGECFAEVAFESEAGKYRAFWEQHRAGNSSDGALQQPRQEIVNADGSDVLDTKKSGVPEKIKEAAGLSFDQFIRSALPAHSDFAAFLRCGAKERSALLERITGREIYDRLSLRVSDIEEAERAALNVIEAEAAAFKDRSEDEKNELELQIKETRLKKAAAEKNLEARNAEYEWLSDMAAIQKELDALEDRRRDLVRRQEGFEPERTRLLRAQKALEFGSSHAALVTSRREQESDRCTLLDCQAKLLEQEAGVRRAEEMVQLAVTACTERQAERKNILEMLGKVRELDWKQKEKDAPIKETQAAADDLAKTINELRCKLDEEQSKFEATQVQMRDIRKFLQDNALDERLIEQFSGIKARFDIFCDAIEKRRRIESERAGADKLKQEAQSRLDGQSLLLETSKGKFASMENSVKKQKGALAEILGSRAIADWRESAADMTARGAKLLQIEETLKLRAESTASLQELKGKAEANASSRAECMKKISASQERISVIENELRLLNRQVELICRIKELEEARTRLGDGEPCPLCGSTTHPYATGNIPMDDEVQLIIRRAKDELRRENDVFSGLGAENARLDQEALQLGAEEERLGREMQEQERRLTGDLTAIELILPMDVAPLAAIGRERQRTDEVLQRASLVVQRTEKGEELLRSMQDDLEILRQGRDQLASSQQELEFRKENAACELERLTKDLRLHDEDMRNTKLDLIRQISPFGFKNLPDERPEQVLDVLAGRLEKWREQHALRGELEKKLSLWELDIRRERDRLDALNLDLKDRNEGVKKLKAEKAALKQQRVTMFGEKDPDKEEAKQNLAAEAAQKHLEVKQEARGAATAELSNMRSRTEELGKSMHTRAAGIQKAELFFKKQLIANGLGNEDAYLAACLPEAERRVLQERASALDKEHTELNALNLDRRFCIEELRRKHITDITLEEAAEKKAEAAARLKELQRSAEELSISLKEDEGLSSKRAELAERLERQTREWRRWESLHDLASSGDGQKDGNFAQALAFEVVLRSANRQLQKMTDRCLLERDEQNALSFYVSDNRTGRRCPPENLSGGENFIVSLALALGLSQISCQNAKSDSLFLDEWVGDEPDEEWLDMALSALKGMKREGKTIGIISRAEALKERIAAQIQVIPQGNGHSFIKAPGCTGGV